MLKNAYLAVKIGVDTAENEPSKIWQKLANLAGEFQKLANFAPTMHVSQPPTAHLAPDDARFRRRQDAVLLRHGPTALDPYAMPFTLIQTRAKFPEENKTHPKSRLANLIIFSARCFSRTRLKGTSENDQDYLAGKGNCRKRVG